MKYWLGLFGVVLVMTAAGGIVFHRLQDRLSLPDPSLSRPLDHWPDQADLDRLESVQGRTPGETIRILGHPSSVTKTQNAVIWEYPWVASCQVTFRNGIVVETFYTRGY